MTKKLRQVCKCESCGNEAEMELTCSLEEYEAAAEESVKDGHDPEKKKHPVKATGTCTHCGNEADMWIDV